MTIRRADKARVVKRSRPVKGKKIVLAPTVQVAALSDVAAEFMQRIFDLRPGDYLITDESDLLDFVPFDESTTAEVWQRIESEYNVGFEDVRSGRLVRLFEVIGEERRIQ